MIDNLALALSHGLLLLVAWRFVRTGDDEAAPPSSPFARPGAEKDPEGA
jgi:hypothetical protein